MDSLELTKILKRLKDNPEILRILDTDLDDVLPDKLGWAGTIRNAIYRLQYLGDDKPLEVEERICTGIAFWVKTVVDKEIKARNPDFINIESVYIEERIINGWHHTTSVLKMKNGETFVLDYHQTLNPENPMVYKSYEDWKNEKGGQTAEDYLKEHPVLNENKVNVGPPESIQSGASAPASGSQSANVFTRIAELLAEIDQKIQRVQANLQV